ncbi:MAG TPA: serine hydrolase [Candidatus Udaeobacter sp.]|nr:serine hydrolase [Candidatus Udaeobacter sp.]
MLVLGESDQAARTGLVTKPCVARIVARIFICLLIVGVWHDTGVAADPTKPDQGLEARIQGLIPDIERYITSGMKAFDVPGLAIGIVANDKLVYGKGFGVRAKEGGATVDTRTVFQIGSATKGFLATTLAMMVDRGRLKWDERVVDLYPDFQMKDPWVTREFRVFDLIAQRSGLPPYANDMLGMVGVGEADMIRSLRNVDPVSSFRSTFAYTNITHVLAGRIVAKAAGTADWNTFLRQELLAPLGMKDSSYTADGIAAAPNHAEGYRWTPEGTVAVPFTQLFPYDFGGAGDINSTIEDTARWVRLQLSNGTFEGRRFVSPENLAQTRTPKVALNDKVSYALGWVVQQTPKGNIIWHNGGTTSFGAYIGFVPETGVGVTVLTNESNVGFPDALGLWTLDRLLGNPSVDHVAKTLEAAKGKYEGARKQFARPDKPRPSPAVAPLAGNFANPSFGKAVLRPDSDALILELQATGAQFRLETWDGDIFSVRLMPSGHFAAVAKNLGDEPNGLAQFQADASGKPAVLRITFDDGQAYDFRREGK